MSKKADMPNLEFNRTFLTSPVWKRALGTVHPADERPTWLNKAVSSPSVPQKIFLKILSTSERWHGSFWTVILALDSRASFSTGRAATAAHHRAVSSVVSRVSPPAPTWLRSGGPEVWGPYPLMTAIGRSLMAFLLIPASWQVFTTSVTFL